MTINFNTNALLSSMEEAGKNAKAAKKKLEAADKAALKKARHIVVGAAVAQQVLVDEMTFRNEERRQLEAVLSGRTTIETPTPTPEPTPEPAPTPTPEPVAVPKPTVLGGFGNGVINPNPAPRAVARPKSQPFWVGTWVVLQWVFACIGALIAFYVGWVSRGWVSSEDMPALLETSIQYVWIAAVTSIGFFGGGWIGTIIEDRRI